MRRERSGQSALVLAVAVVITVVLLFTTNWSGHSDKSAARDPSPTASSTAPSTSHSSASHSSRPKPSAAPTLSAAQRRAAATAKVAALDKGLPSGSVSVAALNMKTGSSYSWGSTSGMWTASVYKLFVLETLLIDHGGPLTGTQADEAVPMIENSDNTAGYELFLAAGGRSGLLASVGKLGLKHTVPGHADPAFTITSAMDMITLLKNLVTSSSPLTAASRSYALNLMEKVESDQRWGVGVIADKGTDFANKNGWLSIDNSNGPGEDDNGLWAVNSVGVVRVKGQQVLMAVMTRHRPDFDSGVDLVQDLARAIEPAVAA